MSPSRLVPGSRIGPFPYQIVMPLGETGNMSDVYLASVGPQSEENTSLVVLKISRTGDDYVAFYRQSMDNEVERLRRLKHPSIVRIYPIQREGGIPNLPYTAEATALPGQPWFTVAEYLPGGSLTQIIGEGAMDIGMALEIARSLAAALDYLHSRNQVHLDLKPDNVLFRTRPAPGKMVEPVLIDFGIARDIGQRGLEARTLQYAAPERVQDPRQPEKAPENQSGPATPMDVYALGVILYEMLTGRLPFRGRSRSSMASEILRSNPQPPSQFRREVNPDLDRLVLRCLAQHPQDRPTALDLSVQLEEIAIRGDYLPRYPSRSDDVAIPATPRRNGRGGQALALLLAIVAVVQLFWLAGTYPYWRQDAPFHVDSLSVLSGNLRQLTEGELLPRLSPLWQWTGTLREGMAVESTTNPTLDETTDDGMNGSEGEDRRP